MCNFGHRDKTTGRSAGVEGKKMEAWTGVEPV